MTQLTLSRRDRRTLIVGALIVAPVFIAGKAMPATLEWERARVAEASVAFREAAEARSLLRSLPAMRDSLLARRTRLAILDASILSASTPIAAAAALASDVGVLADSALIKITSMQLRADTSSRSAIVTVGVRLTGLGDVSGLASFLDAVEGGDTPLMVRDLSVSQPDPAAPDSKPEVLRIDVAIEAPARVQPGRNP